MSPNKVFFSISSSASGVNDPVNIVDFLPRLFLSTAALSDAIFSFSSAESVGSGIGGVG